MDEIKIDAPQDRPFVVLPGGKILDPKREAQKLAVLPFAEFLLMHNIAMAGGEGYSTPLLNPALTKLVDLRFVKMLPNGKWAATDEGLENVRPRGTPREFKKRTGL